MFQCVYAQYLIEYLLEKVLETIFEGTFNPFMCFYIVPFSRWYKVCNHFAEALFIRYERENDILFCHLLQYLCPFVEYLLENLLTPEMIANIRVVFFGKLMILLC